MAIPRGATVPLPADQCRIASSGEDDPVDWPRAGPVTIRATTPAVSTRNADDFPGCGIEIIDPWMRTAKLPRNHGWPAARKEKTIREHSGARRAESQNLGNREPA